MTRPSRSALRVPVVVASAAAGALAIAAPVAAHDGRGPGGITSGLVHPILGTDHLLAMVAVGVLAAVAGSRRVAWALPLAFLAGMVIGGGIGVVTGGVGVIELAIAGSVIVLGALVVVGRVGTGPLVPLGVGALGAVHGHAHGAELPAGAVPVVYVAGFVVATVVLHLIGVAVGLVARDRELVRMVAGSCLTAAGAAVLIGI